MNRAIDFVVEGQRKNGMPWRTWKKQAEEDSMALDLSREDAIFQSRCNVALNQAATRLRGIRPP